jgi:hypothetical protein
LISEKALLVMVVVVDKGYIIDGMVFLVYTLFLLIYQYSSLATFEDSRRGWVV